LVGCSVCPHDEILQNLLTWKTGYVAIALRRGEGRGNQLMLKTGYVEIASRLVTVACSCFNIYFKISLEPHENNKGQMGLKKRQKLTERKTEPVTHITSY
jgi:hypothetical protein